MKERFTSLPPSNLTRQEGRFGAGWEEGRWRGVGRGVGRGGGWRHRGRKEARGAGVSRLSHVFMLTLWLCVTEHRLRNGGNGCLVSILQYFVKRYLYI